MECIKNVNAVTAFRKAEQLTVQINMKLIFDGNICYQIKKPKNLSGLGFLKGPIIQYIAVEMFSEMVLMV